MRLAVGSRQSSTALGIRMRVLIPTVTRLYLAALIILLLAPLRVVHYHTGFWESMGGYFGTEWTLGREHVLDEVVNVLLFLPLGFLMHRWRRRGSSPSWTTAGLTLACMALLALGVEFAQYFLPWRYASVVDVIADVSGAAVGVAVDAVLPRRTARFVQDQG
jgi:hypothetical protein